MRWLLNHLCIFFLDDLSFLYNRVIVLLLLNIHCIFSIRYFRVFPHCRNIIYSDVQTQNMNKSKPIPLIDIYEQLMMQVQILQQTIIIAYLNNIHLNIQIQTISMKSNLLDNQSAKAAAKRIYQKINFTGGPLQSYEISGLLTETYEYLKIPFKPTARDIKSYTQVLDANKDGQVTLSDLENLAIQYLCGSGVLTNQPFDPSIKKQKFDIQSKSTNSYSSYSQNYSNAQQPVNYPPSAVTYEQSFGSKEAPANTTQKSNTYNYQTRGYLEVTRQIFENHADSNFTIVSEAVPDLLAQTYQTLGRKGYRPNSQDVEVWMKLCDSNGDGHVEYEQYEYFVIRSLQRSGFQVYQ